MPSLQIGWDAKNPPKNIETALISHLFANRTLNAARTLPTLTQWCVFFLIFWTTKIKMTQIKAP